MTMRPPLRAPLVASKAKGFDVTYWQPDEQGRWQRGKSDSAVQLMHKLWFRHR